MTDRNSEILEETVWVKEIVIAAEEGSADAQNELGARLWLGYFVDMDQLGAFYWYCQAIKQGYVEAKYNAGTMLLHGDGGIPKNPGLGISLIDIFDEAFQLLLPVRNRLRHGPTLHL